MPWDDSGPERLVPFHHPTAPLAVSLSFSQPFWTGSAFSPCTWVTHSPDCCRSYQQCPLPVVLGEARGFPWVLGPHNQLPKPITLQRAVHKLLCPKATPCVYTQTEHLGEPPSLAGCGSRQALPASANPFHKHRMVFLRAVCVEFPILGWRGFSFSAAKYFDSLPSRSLAQCDMLCGDSPLGSPPRHTTCCVPAHRVLSSPKQPPWGSHSPPKGNHSQLKPPRWERGQGKKALCHSCLKARDGWLARRALPPSSQRIPHSEEPPDCTSGCLISHQYVDLNEETTRKVGGRTHSSINQENKNLRRNLESRFLSQPMWQGGIDLSNLLSVTMKLYFPLNSPTNVTDG